MIQILLLDGKSVDVLIQSLLFVWKVSRCSDPKSVDIMIQILLLDGKSVDVLIQIILFRWKCIRTSTDFPSEREELGS